jgi:hypothetical protein
LYEAAVAKELGIIHQGTNNNTYCIVGFWWRTRRAVFANIMENWRIWYVLEHVCDIFQRQYV